ncbi:lysylphosphatidylglycerol synthase domain-containing protein [Paraburkholderia sp. CNPSo 3274]|uniref:lysylphosphatidylglycerol synthase domain-containing protein n=1 Tax=Paraburkholderia sp. CNPSo 3274 TaxID=2940932 RepID=UPI0020B810D6|nr:lysylphosphatidylglycerol synthase domain-containing protein [Paraburkholderia sp. CNPSo 3274]MCP3707548.1 lysylphosphatidylglycerol synthase domain-containing protein [Paraburkholderia sp. CNPSo 3274]
MKWLKWLGLPVGIAILIGLVVHNGAHDVLRVIGTAGPMLLWLVPFHALPLLLDAHAWRLLLDKRAPLSFLWWTATVREAVNRLLPVVGVGGELVGIRLARWKVRNASEVTASVIVEVFVTIAVQYAFSALGVVLIVAATGDGGSLRTIIAISLALVLSAPLPVLAVFLLRRGGVFHAIERWAARLLGTENPLMLGLDGKQLDADLDALMSRTGLMFRAFFWQLGGYMLGAFETWWALALLGHPVTVGDALAIEAITQAVRHAAFMVPAGLGVQEVAVVLLAQLFGVSQDVAFSLALVKRMREVVFGVLALLSWQAAEIVRTRRAVRHGVQSAAQSADALPAVASVSASASRPKRDSQHDPVH